MSTPWWGVDIGGSGIKAAPVGLPSATLLAERVRVPTPQPAEPRAVAEAVAGLLEGVDPGAGIGIAVPAVVTGGVARTAANLDQSWIGTDAHALFTERLGRPVSLINDADAAGLAELAHGAARGRRGTTVLVTLGTGIGTAVIVDGRLARNTELGHLVVDGHNMCFHASAVARKRDGLSWLVWAERVQAYLDRLEELLWPDLVIIGGGVSRKQDRFLPLLRTRAELVVAHRQNDAGILGAALAAYDARVGWMP